MWWTSVVWQRQLCEFCPAGRCSRNRCSECVQHKMPQYATRLGRLLAGQSSIHLEYDLDQH